MGGTTLEHVYHLDLLKCMRAWTSFAIMPVKRAGHAVFSLANTVFLAGGSDGFSLDNDTSISVDAINVQAANWTCRSFMSIPRDHLACCSLAGSGYALGGYSAPIGHAVRTVERF